MPLSGLKLTEMKRFISLFAMVIFMLHIAQAQQVKTTYELTLDGAKDIMATAMAYAKEHNAPGAAVAIVDAAGPPPPPPNFPPPRRSSRPPAASQATR